MALIDCPDCGKQVSSNATACLGCGASIAVDSEAKGSGVRQLTTTQLTSKSLKIQGLMAFALVVIGAFMTFGAAAVDESSPMGGTLLTIGILWWLVNRIRQWWHHG